MSKTMQALDLIHAERPMDITLMDYPEVRDNLMLLAAKDLDTDSMFLPRLVHSLAAAVQEWCGVTDDMDTDDKDIRVKAKLSRASAEDCFRVGAATSITMAVYHMLKDLRGLMSTWGFISAYHLPMDSSGRMVIESISVNMPSEVFVKFMQAQECYAEDESETDWDKFDWGSQTP